jgi:hypothetical protein
MKTNRKDHPIWNYLLEQVPSVEKIRLEWGVEVNDTIKDRLQFVMDCFKSEYCFDNNLKLYGSVQNTFANWLMGIPSAFSVAIYHQEILELAKTWGDLKENATEKDEQKILDNWFNFCAAKFLQLYTKQLKEA